MKKLAKVMLVLLIAASALMWIGISAAQADNVLRLRVTSNGGATYQYWKFSNASRTLQAGDYIEYDVYLHDNSVGVGGIDICFTDGTYMRGTAGWNDQNEVSGNPTADLRYWAYGRWYHRKMAVPAAKVGKTISFWDLAVDGTFAGYQVPAAMYDNLRVTNGSAVTYLWAYYDDNPSQNVAHFSSNVANAQMFPSKTRRSTQVSSHLFYWYDAPSNNAGSDVMIYDPHGTAASGTWSGYGLGYVYSGSYSSQNEAWWERVFQDMKRAGIDIANVVCWGNYPGMSWFQIEDIQTYMVPALRRSGVGIKIALFDDTSSEVSEWNYDNGRGYVTSTPMPLNNTANWAYFYDRKIKPFFQAVPQEFWATHNGATIAAGGRPIIITYEPAWYTYVNTHGDTMWNSIKSSFQSDFGVTPWIIHEHSWFAGGATTSGNGEYSWGSALNGPSIYYNSGSEYYVSNVGPGFDNRLIGGSLVRNRGWGTWLQSVYSGTYSGWKLWDCGLMLVETWNELWEGSGIERSVNYTDSDAYADPYTWGFINRPGNALSETHYIDIMGDKNIETTVGRRDMDATFLETWKIPATVTLGSTNIPLMVRNDGFRHWDPADTNPFRIKFWLENASGGVIANSEGRVALPSIIWVGQETSINWTTPATWPTGSYYLRLDMIADGWTQFNAQGDIPVKKWITIN